MKKGLMCKIFPFAKKCEANMQVKNRYLSMKRSFLVIMLAVTLIPLLVVTGLSYFKYHALIQSETLNNARWNAESTRQTIEAFIDKLTAAVLAISDSYTFAELEKQEILDRVFEKLKAEHRGLVDLSIIGPDGIQRSYSGPFNLSGKDYSDSLWYQKAQARKVYVSEVFLGYRNVPHFVIAVSKKLRGQQQYWVLRASIDVDTLNQFLSRVKSENLIDIFLVNQSGKLQSSSHDHGSTFDESVIIEDIPRSSDISINEKTLRGETILSVVGKVRDTPWFLVIEEFGSSNKKSWIVFKRELLMIFVISMAVIMLAIIPIASVLVSTIRKAEGSHAKILAEVEHANKLASIGRLAAGIAHEVNNPLAIINEKAGLMKDLIGVSEGFDQRDKFLAQIDSISNAVQRSRKIIHRLLGFARKIEVKMEPVQVNTVIEDVLGFLEKEATYQNIKIEKILQPNLPNIMSDEGQMQQIFLNIINNAIDAVYEGGTICISSSLIDGNSIQVVVVDSGPGMPPEVLRNIFEPFFTTKLGKEKHGTGLGLSIVYGLVKQLGGEITVKSDVGAGTAFFITMPIMCASVGESL